MTADEDGAVALTVALSMVLFLALVAVVVDLGQLYAARTRIQTALDAAAIAAAAAADDRCPDHQPGLESEVDSTVGELGEQNEVDGVEAVTPDSSYCADGRITTRATRTVDFVFAPLLGINSTDVTEFTSATFRPALPQRPRPIALCDGVEQIESWLAEGDGAQLRLFRPNAWGTDQRDANHPLPCSGQVTWGLHCFDPGSEACSDEAVEVLLRDGWAGVLSLGLSRDLPNGATDQRCGAATSCRTTPIEMKFGPLRTAVLPDADQVFTVALVSVPDPESGQLDLETFVAVRLTDSKLSGGDNDDWFIELELVDFFRSGVQKDHGWPSNPRICDVDAPGARCNA